VVTAPGAVPMVTETEFFWANTWPIIQQRNATIFIFFLIVSLIREREREIRLFISAFLARKKKVKKKFLSSFLCSQVLNVLSLNISVGRGSRSLSIQVWLQKDSWSWRASTLSLSSRSRDREISWLELFGKVKFLLLVLTWTSHVTGWVPWPSSKLKHVSDFS
jgi:hypothetical protein